MDVDSIALRYNCESFDLADSKRMNIHRNKQVLSTFKEVEENQVIESKIADRYAFDILQLTKSYLSRIVSVYNLVSNEPCKFKANLYHKSDSISHMDGII